MASPAMDTERFLLRFRGVEELLASTVQRFLRECPASMEKISTAARGRSFAELERLAHSLKGVTGIFQADPTRTAAERLEHAAHARDEAAIDEALEKLRNEVPRLQAALRELERANEAA